MVFMSFKTRRDRQMDIGHSKVPKAEPILALIKCFHLRYSCNEIAFITDIISYIVNKHIYLPTNCGEYRQILHNLRTLAEKLNFHTNSKMLRSYFAKDVKVCSL